MADGLDAGTAVTHDKSMNTQCVVATFGLFVRSAGRFFAKILLHKLTTQLSSYMTQEGIATLLGAKGSILSFLQLAGAVS